MLILFRDGDLARIQLDRPAARNALSIEHWEKLAALCAEAAEGGARAIIVSGSGGAFCAGADLGEFGDLSRDETLRVRFRTAMRRGMDALRTLPLPSIAFIDGPCFGAGVALAIACDLRIATQSARFAITPAKMGIGYPQEDVARLVHLVGAGWASRLLFTGEPIDAATAERIGLVESIGDRSDAESIAQALLACDAESISMLKAGISLAERGIASDDAQDRRFDALLGSDRLRQALAARSKA